MEGVGILGSRVAGEGRTPSVKHSDSAKRSDSIPSTIVTSAPSTATPSISKGRKAERAPKSKARAVKAKPLSGSSASLGSTTSHLPTERSPSWSIREVRAPKVAEAVASRPPTIRELEERINLHSPATRPRARFTLYQVYRILKRAREVQQHEQALLDRGQDPCPWRRRRGVRDEYARSWGGARDWEKRGSGWTGVAALRPPRWFIALQLVKNAYGRAIQRVQSLMGFTFRMAGALLRWLDRARERIRLRGYTAIEQEMHRVVEREGLLVAVADPSKLSTRSLAMQADIDMLRPEPLERRMLLRHHEGIKKAVQAMWDTLPKCPKPHPDYIDRQIYQWMSVKLIDEFVSGEERKRAVEQVDSEWWLESKKEFFMDYDHFFDAIFSLLDVWSLSLDPDEYIFLARRLTGKLASTTDFTYSVRLAERHWQAWLEHIGHHDDGWWTPVGLRRNITRLSPARFPFSKDLPVPRAKDKAGREDGGSTRQARPASPPKRVANRGEEGGDTDMVVSLCDDDATMKQAMPNEATTGAEGGGAQPVTCEPSAHVPTEEVVLGGDAAHAVAAADTIKKDESGLPSLTHEAGSSGAKVTPDVPMKNAERKKPSFACSPTPLEESLDKGKATKGVLSRLPSFAASTQDAAEGSFSPRRDPDQPPPFPPRQSIVSVADPFEESWTLTVSRWDRRGSVGESRRVSAASAASFVSRSSVHHAVQKSLARLRRPSREAFVATVQGIVGKRLSRQGKDGETQHSSSSPPEEGKDCPAECETHEVEGENGRTKRDGGGDEDDRWSVSSLSQGGTDQPRESTLQLRDDASCTSSRSGSWLSTSSRRRVGWHGSIISPPTIDLKHATPPPPPPPLIEGEREGPPSPEKEGLPPSIEEEKVVQPPPRNGRRRRSLRKPDPAVDAPQYIITIETPAIEGPGDVFKTIVISPREKKGPGKEETQQRDSVAGEERGDAGVLVQETPFPPSGIALSAPPAVPDDPRSSAYCIGALAGCIVAVTVAKPAARLAEEMLATLHLGSTKKKELPLRQDKRSLFEKQHAEASSVGRHRLPHLDLEPIIKFPPSLTLATVSPRSRARWASGDLPVSSTLSVLTLRNAGLRTEDVEQLCGALLASHAPVKAVDLSGNPDVLSDAVVPLMKLAAETRTLFLVRLDGCGMRKEAVVRLGNTTALNVERAMRLPSQVCRLQQVFETRSRTISFNAACDVLKRLLDEESVPSASHFPTWLSCTLSGLARRVLRRIAKEHRSGGSDKVPTALLVAMAYESDEVAAQSLPRGPVSAELEMLLQHVGDRFDEVADVLEYTHQVFTDRVQLGRMVHDASFAVEEAIITESASRLGIGDEDNVSFADVVAIAALHVQEQHPGC